MFLYKVSIVFMKTTRYTKKGLSLWLRTFIHTFVMVHKGMSCLNFEDFASSP
jgi:hypothetical protein